MEWQLISDSSREGKMSSGPEAPTRVEDIMKRNSSPSFYDGKNDVTCGKSGGKQQSRPRALSGNAAKPCAREERG